MVGLTRIGSNETVEENAIIKIKNGETKREVLVLISGRSKMAAALI